MSDLQNKLLEVVQESLGAMEVASIKQLIEENEKLSKKAERAEHWEREYRGLQGEHERANDKLVNSVKDIEVLNKELSHAQSQMQDMQRKQAVFDYLMDDRDKLFGIVGSAYKHYTHTTTRQEVVSGGQCVEPHFNNDGTTTGIATDLPESVQNLTTTTTAE